MYAKALPKEAAPKSAAASGGRARAKPMMQVQCVAACCDVLQCVAVCCGRARAKPMMQCVEAG